MYPTVKVPPLKVTVPERVIWVLPSSAVPTVNAPLETVRLPLPEMPVPLADVDMVPPCTVRVPVPFIATLRVMNVPPLDTTTFPFLLLPLVLPIVTVPDTVNCEPELNARMLVVLLLPPPTLSVPHAALLMSTV